MENEMQKKSIFFILFLISTFSLFSQGLQIRKIYFERNQVFEPNDKDWFFASSFLNFFHYTTREYIIKDELLFSENSVTDEEYIYETERNLRATELFSNVRVELDSLGYNSYNAYIITKDRWSLYPALLFGSGGGVTKIGGRLEEFNILGTGTYIKLEALHRSENNIGWQGFTNIKQRRLFRSDLSLDMSLQANKYRTDQIINLSKNYLTLDTKYSYGLYGYNSFGSNFIYKLDSNFTLVPFNEQRLSGFFSRAWFRNDRVIATGLIEYHNVDRTGENIRLGYDNTGKILMMFSSVSQRFHPVEKINYYHVEDMPIGGYGSATLGKVFPIGSKDGDNAYYVGGQGEISYYNGKLYMFGQLTGASSFMRSNGVYTYQEFLGLSFYKPADWFVIAARLRQQTVWNWYGYRQLLLDNERGLRGYRLNQIAGENRILGNLELRFFPDWTLWIFKLSGDAFYDIGSVWDQDQKLSNSQFYSSVGAGIRFHFTKSANPGQTFRIDFAYNLHEGKLGGIILTTRQLFSAFGSHDFRLPELFGISNDIE
jgi:outer membrane protein assembly factor BamA